MMNYDEFKAFVCDKICHFLPDEYRDAAVKLEPVVKNNERNRDALIIQKREQKTFPAVSPVIYMEHYYENYKLGTPLKDILKSIAESRINREMDADISYILNFENVKDLMVCRLVNYERNEQWLEDKPYKRMEDLAIVYYIHPGKRGNQNMYVSVTDSLLDYYGLTVDELHSTALSNMEKFSPLRFASMHDVMLELMAQDTMNQLGIDKEEAVEMVSRTIPSEDGIQMYCLSNRDNAYGAAEILRPQIREMIAEQAGGDYYIIPSSVHELLIIPKTENYDYRELEEMVKDVNASQVSPEEQLSDHVYEYDAEQKMLYRSDLREETREYLNHEKEKTKLQSGLHKSFR